MLYHNRPNPSPACLRPVLSWLRPLMTLCGQLRNQDPQTWKCTPWVGRWRWQRKQRGNWEGRRTRASLLIESPRHCLRQDQLPVSSPCPSSFSAAVGRGHHLDPATPLCPHKSTVASWAHQLLRLGVTWSPSIQAHILHMRRQKHIWDEATHPSCIVNNPVRPFRHYTMLKCLLNGSEQVRSTY